MTRLELIKLIGDILTKLDVLRGSLLPGEPDRVQIDDLRKHLDHLQLQLVKSQFDDNTQDFLQAGKNISAINKDLKQTIDNVEQRVTTIANLKRFVAAVDSLVTTFAPFF